MIKDKSFLIVGLGLLGGSIAMGLKKWNHKVYAIDIDPKEQLAVVWFTPFDKVEWVPEPLYNVQNIIWSGLI